MRILVLTRSYPAPGDLYKYPFVHRRVLAYVAAGDDVRVFQAGPGARMHEFEGVSCRTGGADSLRALVGDFRPDVIAAHGFSEAMWEVLEPLAGAVPVRAWLHGSEIPGFMRRKALVAAEAARPAALAQVEARCAFWRAFLERVPPRFGLVFVSATSIELAREDWGDALGRVAYRIIPNPVDTDLFSYRQKSPEDRFNTLLVRPFDSHTYANDLAVETIARLAARDRRRRLRFTLIGDGPLFEETVAPLRGLAGVRLRRGFLTQREVAREHRGHGLFLVPTRLDTQGVSRDEAMASGLVPVTNAIPAVREFVDPSCAALAPPDDGGALADALWAMVEDPGLFLARSSAAADRIRGERSNALIIPRELALLEEAADG